MARRGRGASRITGDGGGNDNDASDYTGTGEGEGSPSLDYLETPGVAPEPKKKGKQGEISRVLHTFLRAGCDALAAADRPWWNRPDGKIRDFTDATEDWINSDPKAKKYAKAILSASKPLAVALTAWALLAEPIGAEIESYNDARNVRRPVAQVPQPAPNYVSNGQSPVAHTGAVGQASASSAHRPTGGLEIDTLGGI